LIYKGYIKLQGTNLDTEDFSDIAKQGIVEVVGDDLAGRKIIVISACKYVNFFNPKSSRDSTGA